MLNTEFKSNTEPYLYKLLKFILLPYLANIKQLCLEIESFYIFLVITPYKDNLLEERECFINSSEFRVIEDSVLLA